MRNAETIKKALDKLEEQRVRFEGVDAFLEVAGFEVLDVDESDPERIIERYWTESATKGKVFIVAFELDPAMGCSGFEVREEFIEDADLFR